MDVYNPRLAKRIDRVVLYEEGTGVGWDCVVPRLEVTFFVGTVYYDCVVENVLTTSK